MKNKFITLICLVLFVSCGPDKVVHVKYANGEYVQKVINETYVGTVIVNKIGITANGGAYFKVHDFNGNKYEFYAYEIVANIRDTVFIDAPKEIGYCYKESFEVRNFRNILIVKDKRTTLTTRYSEKKTYN